MANNYILLRSIQLTETTASVTFSNIPQSGYTDLKVLTSTRMTASGYGTDMTIAFNGSTSNFEGRRIYGYSGSAYSDTQSNVSGLVVGTSATANTFSVNELYIPNYLSSNVKSYSIDAVSENNSATAYLLEISANRWLSTAAINSITFGVSASSFAAGSSFSLYGIAATGTSPIGAPKASGGNTVISDGTYWYHAFTSSGTFTPVAGITADVLVVAGGGAGGGSNGGGAGGGGAGGLLGFASQSLTAQNYTCTVGAGGAAVASVNSGAVYFGNNGTNSQFGALTAAVGGGGGAATNTNPSNVQGNTGGSGGGGANFNSSSTVAGIAGTSGQGYAGGGTIGPGFGRSAGGGGGAGAVGGTGNSSNQGAGGIGATYNTSVGGSAGPYAFIDSMGAATGAGILSSSHYYFAGGGGGASAYGGASGGIGGGGAGIGNQSGGTATSGTANTGGGGGGSSGDASGIYTFTSGSGGSGIVIVRYAV
jgi:hypothetical protein